MNTANEVIHQHIDRRIKRNANAMILVIGDVGSGKTYFSLDFALERAKRSGCNFDESWVQFGASPFFKAVLEPHKKGQPILADEFGTFMSARMALSKANRAMSFLLQTCRFYNHVLLFTVPQFTFIDAHARKLFHYIVECTPRFKDGKNYVSFRSMKENRKNPLKPFRQPIPYKVKETGEIKHASTYETTIPPDWLVKDYEDKRGKYIKDLYTEQMENLDIGDEKQAEAKTTLKVCNQCGSLVEGQIGKPLICECGERLQ